MKKCPICYSILPSKVIFCPVCGTELQTQISDTPPSTEASFIPPMNNPAQRQVFRDEPIETTIIDSEFSELSQQYAWKISDSAIPFEMKGQIKYVDSFNQPKIIVNPFKNMKLHEILFNCSLGILTTIFLLLQIGTIGAIILYPQSSLLSKISILIVSTFISGILLFLNNQRTTKILSKDMNINLNKVKRNFLSFSIIHGIHLVFVGLIVTVSLKIVVSFTDNLLLNASIYTFSVLLILLYSFISPPFRIAKILTSLRDSGIFQYFNDALQFPKFSIKRSLEYCLFSFILPSAIILAGINSIFKIITAVINPAAQLILVKWDFFMISITLLLLTINFIFMTVTDAKTFINYENIIQTNLEPPVLNWINAQKESSEYRSTKGPTNFSSGQESQNYLDREERCPTCSTLLVEGAEFCTDCGKKVIR
ncbi:MAG: hypothetical protein V3V41_02275 [Candidatus Heimdallarchaeota archaeon]